jgi:nitroimidazol reductase NimA-like FMN-containing flavoprotein (pyridoxamine 5'-phosphate oxidase superfamily)
VQEVEGRAPLTVPIWYGYEPGGLVTLMTGRRSRKTRLIERSGRFSLAVQQETLPYRYVTVEGPVVAVEPIQPEELEALRERYLGPEVRRHTAEAMAEQVKSVVVVRMRPERWRSEDYGDDVS